MKEIQGTSNRYLCIDMTTKTWSVYKISTEDLRLYLGGKGLGIKIFYDRLKDRLGSIDPLGEENLLIFSNGVLLSTGAPCSARFEVITKSPLTGLMVASSCGGPLGEASKTAGWDGIIVAGRAEAPTVVRLDSTGATFESGEAFWGMGTHEVQEALGMTVKEGAAVIGPAGENLVPFANICSGHRFAGRGGVGAVMGSKNLKAIVARGREYTCVPVDPVMFEKNMKKVKKHILRNNMTKSYRAYGTNANVRHGIRTGYSPVRNFRDRYHPDIEATSGEAMAKRYSTRHSTCRHCMVLCGHKGRYPDGKMRQIPEYETIGLFGSNIDNYDPDIIGEWNDLMNELGMDTISAGGVIAWAMEAGEKGLRRTKLAFGKVDNISATLKDIAFRRGEGEDLAKGVRWMSETYGGTDFAIHAKGLEIAAYDPRAAWGHGLSYAVHNKGGCHLGSYLIGMEVLLGYMPRRTTIGKHHWVAFLEDLYTGINSLQGCLFSGFSIMTEPAIPKYLPKAALNVSMLFTPRTSMMLMNWSGFSRFFWAITGHRLTQWDFKRAGERINKLERYINVQMGMKAEEDTLPKRFTEEAVTKYPETSVVPIEKMVKRYYRIRGYDPATGGPTEAQLQKLGVKL